MKKLLTCTALAVILLAPSAFATQDNSAAISGSNNDLIQQTGTGNVLATGSGAFGTTNTGGAGGTATATGGTGGSVIGSGNSTNVNTALGGAGGSVSNSGNSSSVAPGGQGGRGGDGGTGIGIGGNSSATGGSQSQSATTGNQSINVEAQKRAAATAFAAPLVTGYECNGSTSAGFQAPGVGFSVGGTHPSVVCETVFLSRELERKGKHTASLGVLCENEQVRRNMQFEDDACPQDTAGAQPAPVASSAPEWRDRSGYPTSGNTSKH